jgi:hypothetical protein
MFLSLFVTCAVSLGIATVFLLAFGHRLRFSSRIVGLIFTTLVVAGAGEAASALVKIPSSYIETAQIVLLFICWVVVFARPRWNAFGQAFYGSLLAAALTYVAFACYMTFFTRLSGAAMVASTALLLLEAFALTLAVQACRVLAIWLMAEAAGVHLGPRPFYVMGPLLFLVGLIPFTINGIAVRESFFLSFLGGLGVGADQAFATGFLYFLLSIGLAIPGGAIFLWENVRGLARPVPET